MSYHYLLDLALILLSTKVLSLITRKIKMPQVVGALLAGLILGPSMLNILSETEFISQMSEMGVIVILFSAGMGTDIKELKRTGGAGFVVALCGVLIPLLMGTGLALACRRWGLIPDNGLIGCFFVGTVLTATSVSITVETLKELGRLETKVGNTILAAALIDDVLGLIVLTIVTAFTGGGESIGPVLIKIALFFVFALGAGSVAGWLFDLMIKRADGRDLHRYPILAFVLCLLMSWCAERFFGVSDIIGAFAAGLVISTTPKAKYVESKFEPLSYLLLTPIFYASIGIGAKIEGTGASVYIFSALLFVTAIASKLIGCGLGARLCSFTRRESLQTGVGMACRGEVALIVANRGIAAGVLPEEMLTPFILTVVGCAILTPVMLKLAFAGSEGTERAPSPLTEGIAVVGKLDAETEKMLRK